MSDAEAASARPLSSASGPRDFGDYELEGVIARGSMGVVWRARQKSLNRRVALKTVTMEPGAPEARLERFHTEARAAARLRHPRIVPVHDVGVHEGQHYYSMELIEGRSLADLLREGPLEPERAARVVAEVAGAIQYAHEQGVIHRDLKPSNVLLDEAGDPWVADFGVAKTISGEADLTVEGELVGTPGYMAPEQAGAEDDGRPPGAHTDVYGLGALLYALVSGRPPFLSASVLTTLQMVREREPLPLRALNPALPRDLETIAQRCMQRRPERRYGSASEVRDELRRWLRGEPIEARPVGRLGRAVLAARRRPALALLGSLAVVSTLGGVVGIVWQSERAVSALERVRAEQMQALNVAEAGGFLRVLASLEAGGARLASIGEEMENEAADRRLALRGLLLQLSERAAVLERIAPALLDLAGDPAEFATTIQAIERFRPRIPDDAWRAFLGSLEATFDRPQLEESQRLSAAASLAALAPERPSWQPYAGALAERLVAEDPFLLAFWEGIFQPLPPAVASELAAACRGPDAVRSQRATEIVATLARERTELLLGLLFDVDPERFATLFRVLAGSPRTLLAHAEAALRPRAEPVRASPAPLAAGARPWVAAVLAAGGIATPAFALVPDAGIDGFLEIAQELELDGYRPARIRPFDRDGEPRFASLWRSDGTPGRLDFLVDGEELRAACERHRAEGFAAADVGLFFDPSASEVRYVAAWEPASDARSEVDLSTATSMEYFVETVNHYWSANHALDSLHVLPEHGLFAAVWSKRKPLQEFFCHLDLPHQLADDLLAGMCAVDVQLFPAGRACVWRADPARASATLGPLGAEEHRERAYALLEHGYEPSGLGVADAGGGIEVLSVWHTRRASLEHAIAEERRRTLAAAALLRAGDAERAFEFLAREAPPGVRERFAVVAVDCGVSLAELARACASPSAKVRRLALLALGQAPRERELEELAARHEVDPDAAVRAAAVWLQARWGLAPTGRPAPAGAGYFRTGLGQTLVELDPRQSPFSMGSPAFERGRKTDESAHPRRVPRAFAIGATEVTFAEAAPFFAEHPEFQVRVTADPDRPAPFTWLAAAAYCRWLSEREGLAQDEMCFPPIEEIARVLLGRGDAPASFDLDAAVLERAGYRMPTEGEWEFACRAGSGEAYAFGSDRDLLPHFAQCRGNTRDEPGPVARKMPSAFGLFDMHGNVYEWCVERPSQYRFSVDTTPYVPLLELGPVDAASERIARGGHHDSPDRDLRCAFRDAQRASLRTPSIGLRLARTR